jgi:ubiquinone/menaquinone biosynthesis C-methylase UbiE
MSDRVDPAVEAAWGYERLHVAALFRQWATPVLEAADVSEGHRVLDVACGTGVVAREARARVGPTGAVTGLDLSPGMLAVAESIEPDVTWVEGEACALPFEDDQFDAVVSQFGLMFFDDRVAALREMQRVLRPGGWLVVAVCDALEHSPGYAALAALLERLFGKAVADAFRSPFVLGDAAKLLALCADAGIADAKIVQREGTVRFDSIDALVSTERACVWTLGGLLDDAQFERLRLEAQEAFRPFVDGSGQVAFAMPALLVCAGKR